MNKPQEKEPVKVLFNICVMPQVRTIGLAEQYICFVDTENFAYEWGMLSDIEHQENLGFISNPLVIDLLNQKEIKNITAGPDFILSDTVVREEEVSQLTCFLINSPGQRTKGHFIWEAHPIM
jgi:hypothetical protein